MVLVMNDYDDVEIQRGRIMTYFTVFEMDKGEELDTVGGTRRAM